MSQPLPVGVKIIPLTTHTDERGQLTEIYKDEWINRGHPIQWNLTHALPNTLRGMHLHPYHADYLVVSSGTLILGLADFRRNSPSFGLSCLLELKGETKCAGAIPPGVAHGFCFLEAATYVYGLDHYWSPDKDLVYLWNDPWLKFKWPLADPVISEKDRNGLPYAEFQELVDAHTFEIHE